MGAVELRGCSAVELGAGTGLVGIVAALLGECDVVLPLLRVELLELCLFMMPNPLLVFFYWITFLSPVLIMSHGPPAVLLPPGKLIPSRFSSYIYTSHRRLL